MADPLDGLVAWAGEALFNAADDALVDGLVKAGDITPADGQVLKKAGPIYLKAVLAAAKQSAAKATSSPT